MLYRKRPILAVQGRISGVYQQIHPDTTTDEQLQHVGILLLCILYCAKVFGCRCYAELSRSMRRSTKQGGRAARFRNSVISIAERQLGLGVEQGAAKRGLIRSWIDWGHSVTDDRSLVRESTLADIDLAILFLPAC